jgi:hypothetical protein
MACAENLDKVAGSVGLMNFNIDMPAATGFKDPMYYPRDKITRKLVPGGLPSMYYKLFVRGKPPYEERTLFTHVGGKVVSWASLKMVYMKYIPLFHIKGIYAGGGKASIQMEMVSAIITDIRAKGSESQQTSTMSRLQQTRPELVDDVTEKLARLEANRRAQSTEENEETKKPDEKKESGTKTPPESQSTFTGITPISSTNPENLVSQGRSPGLHDLVDTARVTQTNIPPIPVLNKRVGNQ